MEKPTGRPLGVASSRFLNGCSKCKFSTCHYTFLVLPASGLDSFPSKFPPIWEKDGLDIRHTWSSQRNIFSHSSSVGEKIISWPPRFPYFGVYASHYLLDDVKDMWLWWDSTPVIILFYPGWPRFNQVNPLKAEFSWTSLVVQWLRIDLPMQGTWVQSLVPEGPVFYGTSKPTHHNPVLRLLKPVIPTACAPQQEKPPQREARHPNYRTTPTHHN